jgi:hypothetical protein
MEKAADGQTIPLSLSLYFFENNVNRLSVTVYLHRTIIMTLLVPDFDIKDIGLLKV